jgi:hypothetical protein
MIKLSRGTLLVATLTTLVGSLVTTGCSKAGKGESSSTSSSCSPEHTTVAEGGFCVKVPKAWQADPPETKGGRTRFGWFRKGQGGSFAIELNPTGTMPADIESTIGKAPGSTANVTKGEFAGGKGKWALSLSDKGNLATVLVAGPKGLLHCGVSSDEKGVKENLELCKTLMPL